jgi:hypothetical protein
MRIGQSMAVLIAAAGIAMSAPAAAHATSYNSIDYFQTQVPNACLAADTTNRGTYVRQVNGPAGECSGLATYHAIHGANLHPWSTESFYIKDGYLRQSIELFSDESTGVLTSYRAFRNQVDSWKGIPVLPATFQNSAAWNYPVYHEEYWTNNQGQPVCYNTQTTWIWGSVNWAFVYGAGTFAGWLQDKRSVSLNKNAWRDVDVIVREDQWGSAPYNYELYYYARWQNPANGQWQGLGIIKWEHYYGSSLIASGEQHYLADCTTLYECTTCPP